MDEVKVIETVREGEVVHREAKMDVVDGVEIWWTWDPVAGNLSELRVNGCTVLGMLPSMEHAVLAARGFAAAVRWCARACEASATVDPGDDVRGQGGRDAVLAMAAHFRASLSATPAPAEGE